MRGAWLAMVGLVIGGCERSDQGIAVGNPGDSKPSMADGDDVTFTSARTTIGGWRLTACDGDRPVEASVQLEVDLLDAEPIALPSGTWCGQVRLLLDSPVYVEGQGPDATFEATLELGDIVLLSPDGALDVAAGDPHVLELGEPGWISVADLGLEVDEHRVIDAETFEHGRLADGIRLGSGLFREDGDGALSAPERDAGPVASGPVNTLHTSPFDPRYVAVGDRHRRDVSLDGETWALEVEGNPDKGLFGATFAKGRVVAVGLEQLFISIDGGASWEAHASPAGWLTAVAASDLRFVAVGDDGRRMWSYDGRSWFDDPGGLALTYRGVAFGDEGFVAVGLGGVRSHSWDGLGWDDEQSGGADLYDVAYGNGYYVAVGMDGRIVRSADGTTWTDDQLLAGATKLTSVVFDGAQFVAVGDGKIGTSADGEVWSAEPGPSLSGIAFGDGRFVGVGYDGARFVATDPLDWTEARAGDGVSMEAVTWAW